MWQCANEAIEKKMILRFEKFVKSVKIQTL